MKTKLLSFWLVCWHLFTEVPGWPDAPKWMRWRRALPLFLPCAAILLLALWNLAIRDPHIRAERANHQRLFSLEDEIASLRLHCSEQHAVEMATQAAEAAKLLLSGPTELGPLLLALKKEAQDHHWEASFQAGESTNDNSDADTQITLLPVRGKLSSPAGNVGSFPALIALLERFSTSGKRIDLTRLTIRADEQGRYAVELNLRLACRRIHEKTAQ